MEAVNKAEDPEVRIAPAAAPGDAKGAPRAAGPGGGYKGGPGGKPAGGGYKGDNPRPQGDRPAGKPAGGGYKGGQSPAPG